MFTRDVIKMMSAPFFTQLLGIFIMPILSRLYTPDVYGLYHLFGSIQMPICILATMSYNNAIVLPKRDEVASNLLFISVISTIIIAILSIPFIYFSSEFILRWLKASELSAYLWILPVSVFTYGVQISLLSWNLRNRNFNRIVASKILLNISNKSVLLGAGFSGYATPCSLLVGDIVSSITMSSVLGRRIWRESGRLFKQSCRLYNIMQTIIRYRKFPIYNLWTNIIGRLGSMINMFLFSYYFSKSVIGNYALGVAVLAMPATFVGNAIVEVFYQRISEIDNKTTRQSLVVKIFEQLTWVSMLPFLLIAIIGDNIFSLIFGVKWLEAGVYSKILSFNMFANFIMSPIMVLVNVLEKQEVNFIFYLVLVIVSFISILIGGLFNNIYLSLGLFSLSNGLVYCGAGLLMMYFLEISFFRIFNFLLKCLLSCVIVIAIVALMKWYFNVSSLFLIVISIILSLAYYGILLKKNKTLQSAILMIFKKIKLNKEK